ncbi:MAG: C10 family peptidase [Bacteroidales bacterium]|nr:C10 family peptidase [Bacteroidales bacterium]
MSTQPLLYRLTFVLAKRLLTQMILLVLFLLFFIFTSRESIAQNMGAELVKKAATHWLSSQTEVSQHHLETTDLVVNENGITIAYRFGLSPNGFVVLIADDRLSPVIAYSFTGNYGYEMDTVNPLEELLVWDIENQLKHLDEFTMDKIMKNHARWELLLGEVVVRRLFEQWPPQGTTSTGGWVETNWSQSAPYNNFCPMDHVTNQRSVAGCPSVALAMIINYTNTIHETRFSDDDDYYHNYGGNKYWIDNDFETFDFASFPMLNLYYDSIASKYSDNLMLNENEMAALVFGCGVAAHQVYGSAGSGTFAVGQAYDAILRFGFEESVLVYDSDTSFYSQLQNNIKQAMPVLLALITSDASAGHNLVADGYNTDEFYHLNFGWGGAYNSWYLVPEGIPYNLNVVEGAIMDIGAKQVSTEEINNQRSGLITIYPNPCNSTMHLGIQLAETTGLNVVVRDVDGKTVARVFDGKLNAGQHTLTWENHVEAGLYIVSVVTDSDSWTEKVVIQ